MWERSERLAAGVTIWYRKVTTVWEYTTPCVAHPSDVSECEILKQEYFGLERFSDDEAADGGLEDNQN